MNFDESIRAFERAVDAGDDAATVANARSALRWIRLSAAEKGAEPGQIAAAIERAAGGVDGLFQVQEALRCYVSRPTGPVELRLNGVYQSCEDDHCVALFDDEEKALAYFKSALLPKHLRYTDTDGRFRSFRSDSVCYGYNPQGGSSIEEGHRILRAASPWNRYDGREGFFSAPAPARNPAPLTGDPPPMPAGAVPCVLTGQASS